MTRRNDLQLPASVRRAAAKLRRFEPSDGFQDRVREALANADREGARREQTRRGRAWSRAARGLGLVVVGAVALIAGGLWVQDNGREDVLHRMEQLEVALEGDGHTWLPLTLDTARHGGARANIHVEAPRNVKVKASAHAQGGTEPTCGPERCVHRFDHPTTRGTEPHFSIGVSAPGDYRIYVEHASSAQRVREVFLVAAR